MDDWTDEQRATSAALSAEMESAGEASNLVTRAGSLLRLAKLGHQDMAGTDLDRVLFGFYGAVVLGRSAFFTMKRLGEIPYAQSEFNAWYDQWKKDEADDLFTYFETIRNDVVHPRNRMVGIVLIDWNVNPARPLRRPGAVTFDAIPPPATHKGVPITDPSMDALCGLYIDHLQAMFDSFAPVAFRVADKRMAEWRAARDGRSADS